LIQGEALVLSHMAVFRDIFTIGASRAP
jgi:dihydrodipicolinate reductase